ncbi:MAG: hypothetical protein HYR85_13205 [Planctomycetes bacterium]|nr:hypothetical protein [Planctomycetota bacterium]
MTTKRRDFMVLCVAMAAGLAVRVLLAPIRGQVPDLAAFAKWGAFAADHPVATIWRDGSCDYMPTYPMVLGVLTRLYRLIVDAHATELPVWALKIPPILGDVATTLLLFFSVRGLAGHRVGTAIAALHFLNPAVILESAVWGQVDVLPSFCIVGALLLVHFAARQPVIAHAAAWALLAFAVMFKLQAIVFAPILVLLLVPALRSGHAKRTLAGCGIAVAFVAILNLARIALAGELGAFWRGAVSSALGRYPRLSMHAWNAWWFVPPETRHAVLDTDPFVAGISYRAVGLALFAAALAFALVILWRRGRGRDPAALFLAAAFVAVAFFMLPTQMHDRYLYPALPLLAAAAMFAPSQAIPLYALFTITLTADLTLEGLPLIRPWLIAAMNVAGLVALGCALVRCERSPAQT